MKYILSLLITLSIFTSCTIKCNCACCEKERKIEDQKKADIKDLHNKLMNMSETERSDYFEQSKPRIDTIKIGGSSYLRVTNIK